MAGKGTVQILIVYYSLEGNCQFLAETLKTKLDCSLQRLMVDKEPPKKGVKKFAQGGKMALSGENPGLHPLQVNPASYSVLIVIYPLWAATFPPAIQAFFQDYRSEIADKKIILVCSSMSGKAAGSFKKLDQFLPGVKPAASYSLINPLKKKEKAMEILNQIAAQAKTL